MGMRKNTEKGESGAAPLGKKYERKELPDIDKIFADEADELIELGEKVVALMAKRKALDEEIRANQAIARAYMETVKDNESWSTRGPGWTLSYVKPNDKKTLVIEKLIEQGVTLKQLQKATKETPVSPFVTFRTFADEEE